MRILINGLYLIPSRVGGTETYLRQLVRALSEVDTQHTYVLCLGADAASTFAPPNARWRIARAPGPARIRVLRLALEQAWIPTVAHTLKADVIHSAGYTAPLLSSAVRVTTIHDMNYMRHPEDFTGVERTVYSMLIPGVAARSTRIITASHAARVDILRWTRARPEHVSVVHSGARPWWPGDPVDDRARLTAIGVREPFILSVAAAYPHKNLARLAAALPHDSQITLVHAGMGGRANLAIDAAINTQHPGHIKRLGWVDDATLASLYRRALLVALPSLYEGFGLPIVEAMALGTPVLTSNYGAMAEIAGDAAELVDPRSVDSIHAGLQRLAFDTQRRAELRERGLLRSRDFTWERAARTTLGIYSEALAAG